MENLITFGYHNKLDYSITIRVKAHNKFVLDTLLSWKTNLQALLPSFLKIELKSSGLKPDIILSLHTLERKTNNFKRQSRQTIFSILTHKEVNTHSDILKTVGGSFIKTNFKKKIAVGKIKEGDPFLFALIYIWITNYIVIHYHIILHAACIVDKKDRAIIFVGKNGSGKSTICNLFGKIENFSTLHDDRLSLYSDISNPCSILNSFILNNGLKLANIPFSMVRARYIFFLQKDLSQVTKIISITKREAFNKIIFASEFPQNEERSMKQYRIDTLWKLVNQSRCFLLINGKGLKENPSILIRKVLALTNQSH